MTDIVKRFNLTPSEEEFVFYHKRLNQCCTAVYKGDKPKLRKFLRSVEKIREPRLRFALVAALVRFDTKLVQHKRICRWAMANATMLHRLEKEVQAEKARAAEFKRNNVTSGGKNV